MRASVSRFKCVLMRVFVCMCTLVCACANARVCGLALWSVRNLHSNRKHNSRKSLSSKLFKVEKLNFKAGLNVENLWAT